MLPETPYGGVLFSCGCFTNQITGSDGQGFGLYAIRNPHGPIAVIGPYAESYAIIGKIAFDGLETVVRTEKPPRTLGEYYRGVQKGIAETPVDLLTFMLFDHADGSRGKTKLAAQRREHLEMWTLLGDPATKLPPLPGIPAPPSDD